MPGMISYPAKLPQGQTRDQIVTIMDWFPKVLELCGIRQQADAPRLDGRSMTGVIADAHAASAHEVLHFGWAKSWAVRRGDWELIGMTGKRTGLFALSLRYLAEAAPEVKDHAAEHPEIVREMTALHQAWEKETGPP